MTNRHAIPRVINVAVVEDDREVREALRLTLDGQDGFHCTGSFPSCEEAVKGLPEAPPDVVLMDINLPGMDGIEGVRVLKEKLPGTDFLMLTVREDEETVFRALSAGAAGYLLKHATPEAILDAVDAVRAHPAAARRDMAGETFRRRRSRTRRRILAAGASAASEKECEQHSRRVAGEPARTLKKPANTP